MRKISFSLIGLLVFATFMDAKTLEFWEAKDNTDTLNKWKIHKSTSEITITGHTTNGQITIITDPNYYTKEWRLVQADRNREVVAKRHKNTIVITSQTGEISTKKTIEIDDSPWMQAPGLQLNPFILSPKIKKKIWTITNDSLAAHKMQFKKTARNNNEVEVLMSPVGVGMFLWRGFLWFDRSDGYFLKYSGPSGGVGSPKMETNRVPVTR